jgi:hypothetical protein
MIRAIFAVVLAFSSLATAQETLRPALETTYNLWRQAILRKDPTQWERSTATYRRVEVRNRILSERRAFPAAIFDIPAAPPAIEGLKFLEANQEGATAKASYFGKVDFQVGEVPTENLLVLSFIREGNTWLYDRADYVNLEGLPDVRKELAAGDLSYLKETPEARPSGIVPQTPVAAQLAKIIAKVYVFCPGREVQVQINKISRHRFANAKEAEIVIGGATEGPNEVQFTVKKLEGGKGTEAMTIRVYLFSEVDGVKPVKAFEYQIEEGGTPKDFGTEMFTVDAAMIRQITAK